MLVLGIMSGTSIDGVDYALCDVSLRSIELRGHWAREIPANLRRRLHAAASDRSGVHELAQLHHDLGRLYAHQARGLRPRAELIGLHGQTVFHNPERRAPATLQIGEPSYLAEVLGVPVINNFRSADIACGGQGAPLATLFHKLIFSRVGQHVCVNNLGGISNVTSLDWRGGRAPRVVAFDTGPGNVLLDLAMRQLSRGRQTCDMNGAWAEQGRVHEPLLARWLSHGYFLQAPPKSTGRELFGEKFWQAEQGRMAAARLSKFDVMATLCEFTARSLSLSYRRHLPEKPATVIFCGGGARNRFLLSRIVAALPAATGITTSDEMGWPNETIEPGAFALLAYYRWKRMPANLPSTTGARKRVLLGQITQL